VTHLSLCSGIGGIDLAAEWAGFRTVAVCEIDKACLKVLGKNFPAAHQFTDLKELTHESLQRNGIGRPTLISAGFPCQPFSIAGSRKGHDDERHLWPEVARVLCEVRPKWFLGENVRGLLSIRDGEVYGEILRDLADLGYRVSWGCYGADEAAGLSHRRDRVFIVGYLADNDGKDGFTGGLGPDAGTIRRDFVSGRSGDLANSEVSKQGRDGNEKANGRRDAKARGSGRVLANPGNGRRRDISAIEGREDETPIRGDDPAKTSRPSGDVANANCERRRCGPSGCEYATDAQSTEPGLVRRIPGPKQYDEWRELLTIRPDLAPALSREEEAELSVCPGTDGVSRRMALKMLGNAVVPYQVLPILQEIAAHEFAAQAQI